MLHSTYTHRDQIDSRLLVIGSQTVNLTPDPSFNYNLCCKCSNGSCKAILDIYTLRPFQQYKKHLNARCFDPQNRILSFRESRRTPKSHIRECEWRLHTSLKVGLRQLPSPIFENVSGDFTLPSKWGCDRFELWIRTCDSTRAFMILNQVVYGMTSIVKNSK